jgi:hypothetical protein
MRLSPLRCVCVRGTGAVREWHVSGARKWHVTVREEHLAGARGHLAELGRQRAELR